MVPLATDINNEYGLTHVLLQQGREIAEAYQAAGTPSAVLVRRDGTIGSPLAQGADTIRALVTGAVTLPGAGALPPAAAANGQSAGPPVAKVGEPVPEFTLPDLRGNQVNLSDLCGSKTLVLFWNPACGFCQRMPSDLKACEANTAMGLRSPLVLDQGCGVGNTFGATRTPMAVLVDAEGKIASEVAAGAPALLALAGQVQDAISA